MADFTTLLNRGHKYYIDKNVKNRKFGKCEGCNKMCLLMEYIEAFDPKVKILLCDFCYLDLLHGEEEQ